MKFKVFFKLYLAALIAVLVCITPILSDAMANNNKSKIDPFDTVQKKLIKDGFNAKKIESLYSHKKVDFAIKTVSLFFRHQESTLDYSQFADPKNIAQAMAYKKEHKAILERVQKEYGVDQDVITAIILIETRLGNSLGRSSIFNTLSTMAALTDKKVRDEFWKKMPTRKRITRKKYLKKAAAKSDWAYAELKSFLKYTIKEGVDPLDVYGSYAGAFGIPQFMPSSILAYAKDGNKDGRVDLFNHEDAITSVANYLKKFGWKPNIKRTQARKAIYHYNRSKYYVNTILKVADLLKG